MRNLLSFHKEKRWQPWANTLAYYPLTTETTVSDLSGNNRNLTQHDNSTFWTYGWVDCVYVSWNNASWFHCLTTNSITNQVLWNQFTMMWYGYRSDSSKWLFSGMWGINWSWNWFNVIFNTSDISAEILRNGSINSISYSSGNIYWQWKLLTATYDNWSVKLYLNGSQVATGTYTVGTINILWVGCFFGTQSSWYTYQWNWYISNFILENKARTADEISAYYNQTKAKYWIS